jgi:hypothetical protein
MCVCVLYRVSVYKYLQWWEKEEIGGGGVLKPLRHSMNCALPWRCLIIFFESPVSAPSTVVTYSGKKDVK